MLFISISKENTSVCSTLFTLYTMSINVILRGYINKASDIFIGNMFIDAVK